MLDVCPLARKHRALLIGVAGSVALVVCALGAERSGMLSARLAGRGARPLHALRGLAPSFARAMVRPEPPRVDEDPEDGQDERALVLPTGEAPALDCDQARRIVAQARETMAAPADAIDPAKFASMTSDWLDPHGLWSVAPDSPLGPLLQKRAPELLAELEARPGSGPCSVAESLGGTLEPWVSGLRGEIQDARASARIASPKAPSKGAHGKMSSARAKWELVSGTPFEDGQVQRRAHDLARLLGHGAGSLEQAFGDVVTPYAAALLDRTAPEKTQEEWTRIVLAAAVRAYVPQVDPHGAWAPLDEETSIYDMSLEVDPPEHLWSDMTRTTLGVRIDHGAKTPLRDGDVLLEISGVKLAGLSVEQDNQLSVLQSGNEAQVVVLRMGSSEPATLTVEAAKPSSKPPTPSDPGHLTAKRVSYGDGFVAVVAIPDVPDDLGDRLGCALSEARAQGNMLGVMLDIRGNGGGSTDGAMSALGLFLPGASLFPMRRRDGGIEVDRAPKPSADYEWRGPLAVLVDGESASAAEMIAGGIASYQRGVLIGSRTYGKGCAQEYLDDDTRAGVLRLTTLVFSLPDGSPLQRVGVLPQIALGVSAGPERESFLPHALDSWRGPDVRDHALVHDVPWPSSGGRIGTTEDETVYRALRALGTAPRAAVH